MNETEKILLQKFIDDKLINVQKHPSANLFIYNYTPAVQYERLWNEITLQARGLILDDKMNYVARPFRKFFNFEEHQPEEIPKLPFDVYEKMDGSLGILYWLNDKPFIATRGSFTSDQANHANIILYDKYQKTFDKLDRNATYLFEIIYPNNRIVVNYGLMDDLILLTVIDNKTLLERIEHVGFPVVKKFDGVNDLNELRKIEETNKEGFVIRFQNGFRIKMKFSEYVRLHRIITGISNVSVWEYLSEGRPFDELLDRVPDEFYDWVKKIQNELLEQYNNIYSECESVFKEFNTRKETAEYFMKQKYPHVLFSMLDKKSCKKIIWKLIKPKFSKPFSNEEI